MGALTHDLGIDLGTANTLVHVQGRGVVLQEPSVVALDDVSGSMVAVGHEAKQMLGRTPSWVRPVRPLKNGVISDFDSARAMLRHLIQKVVPFSRLRVRPRVVIGMPAGATAVQERAIQDACLQVGVGETLIVEEPLAAALGVGLPVDEAVGSMIVDIGGGTSEVAIIALGGIVTSRSVSVAGDAMDRAIGQHIKRAYSMMIGERTAETVKIAIGTAWKDDRQETFDVRGRDLISGLPKNLTITSAEIEQAMAEPVSAILDAIRAALEETPPELAADIMQSGMVLTGGGSLLRNFDRRVAAETGLPVRQAADPLLSVVEGTARLLNDAHHLNALRRRQRDKWMTNRA